MEVEEAKEEFTKSYRQRLPAYSADLEAIKGLLEKALRLADVEATVSCRVKDLESALAKFEEKYQKNCEEITEASIYAALTDLFGLRVVVPYDSLVEKSGDIIRRYFTVVSTTDKTAALLKHDDTFGYKGLHLDCTLSRDRQELVEYGRIGGQKFEIQVRSIVQHSWSELDHKLKYKKTIDQSLRRRIYRLAALFELADQEFDAIRTQIESQRDQAIEHADASPLEEVNAFVVVAICNEFLSEELHLGATDGEKFMSRAAAEMERPLSSIELRESMSKYGTYAVNIYRWSQDHKNLLTKHAIPTFAIFKNHPSIFKDTFRELLSKVDKTISAKLQQE